MANWIQAAAACGLLVVTTITLIVLFRYAADTRRIAKAGEAQLEGLKTPFIIFSTAPREAADAILDMDGAHGTMILRFHGSDAVMTNIGNGPAIEINYALTPLDGGHSISEGYIPAIPPEGSVPVPIPRALLDGYRYLCVITYSSLSGSRYETRLIAHNLVLTSVDWNPTTAPSHANRLYRWRTALRGALPVPLYRFLQDTKLLRKIKDCEAVGGEHEWYRTDDLHSSCFHCQVEREGQLWKS